MLQMYKPETHLRVERTGEVVFDLTGSEYESLAKPSILYDDADYPFNIEDVKLISIDEDLFIVPSEEIGEYIIDGVLQKKIAPALKIEAWSGKSSRKSSREVMDVRRKRRSVNAEDDLRIYTSDDDLVTFDIQLTVNRDDEPFIAEFKKACNSTKLKVHRKSVAWVKSTMRTVSDGTISAKSLNQLIGIFKFKYDVKFYVGI